MIENTDFLKTVLSIPTHTFEEDKMIDFLIDYLSEKKYDLEDNNLVKEGSEIKIFSVSELLRRKSLPKQSKETVWRNYHDTEKMINSLSERFKDYEWKVDFKAKGGTTNDIYVLGSNYEIQRPGIDDDDLAKALKKYKVQMYFIDSEGWVELIGEKNNIENLLKDPNVWSISSNELDELFLSKMKKYKGTLSTNYNPSKYMRQYYKDLYSDEDYAKGGKTKESQMTPFQKANQIAEDRFGEFGLATLEHDDFAKVIVMSKANKLAKKYGKNPHFI